MTLVQSSGRAAAEGLAHGNVGLKPSAAARPVRPRSFTPATEPVLQSIHYARSVISPSCAALRRHHGTLFNQDMEPKGEFFWKNHPAKILHWAPRESLSLGIRNSQGCCCHTGVSPLACLLLRVVPSKILNLERKRGQCQDSWVCLSET